MSLDPDLQEMRRLGHLSVDRAVEHLAGIRNLHVARPPHRETLAAVVEEPLPEQGLGVDSSIAQLFDHVLPHATLVNHPRFFAYIPGPGSYVGALGSFLAAATNNFVGTFLGGAVMTQLEVVVLDWLRQAVGLPKGFEGVLTSGGSMANLGALAAARARAARNNVAPEQMTIYVSRQAHYSVAKAARVLGFLPDRLRILDTDAQERMVPREVAATIHRDSQRGLAPLAVCATLGTTNTGAIDPIPALADVCEQNGLWLHVDGAYGAAIALLEEQRHLTEGLERADSITLDPHKWLYAPFESGCLLTRRTDDLCHAFGADGEYMQDVPREEVNFFERGPELSRGNRALKLWLMLRGLGLGSIREAIRKDLVLCRLAHELLSEDPRFEIVTPPRLSMFSFALRDGGEAAGRKLMQDLMADGHLMLSTSQVLGRFVLRFCVVNHRTTEEDIRSSVHKIRELAPN